MTEQKKAAHEQAANTKTDCMSNNSTINTEQARALLTEFNCCFLHSDNAKRPVGNNWQQNPRSPKEWNDNGLGIICGNHELDGCAVHSLDVDALEPDLSTAMRQALIEQLKDKPGRKLCRVGQAPKFLVPFQTKEEMRKNSTKVFYPGGDEQDPNKNQLEVLGAGNQFVAYAIHPGTGKPYQWFDLITGEIAHLCELSPTDLVELTPDDVEQIKKTFVQLASKAGLEPSTKQKVAEQAPKRSYKVNEGDAGIIDRVNAQNVMADVLAHFDYPEKSEKRHLFSESTTGQPGVVVFEDEKDGRERCYSHHGGDPLADGHSHDVFSVFVKLKFNGDVSKAVAHFAPIVDADGQKQRQREHMEQKNSVSVDDFADLERKVKQAEQRAFKLPDYPKELLNLPFMLGELQAFVHNRMTYPSVATAGIAALATMTAFAQTNFTVKSRDGLGLNEYYMVLAPTGFGKEDLRKPIERLDNESDDVTTAEFLAKQGGGNLASLGNVAVRHAAPASTQGVHQILEDNRSTFFLSDEFAEWLRLSHTDSTKQAALGYLMQAYTKALGTIEPGHAVTKQYTPVKEPRLSILATSTSEAMFETMTREQADSGAYNRWLMFVGEQELPQKRYEGLTFDPEQSVVEFIAWLKIQPKTKIKFAADGWQEFKRIDSEQAEPIKRNDALLGGRLAEQAIKLAALIALSDKRLEMTAQDIRAAFNIRIGLYKRAKALVDHEGSMDGMHSTGQALKQVCKLFENQQGIYRSQIANRSRKYQKLSVPERKAVIDALISEGIASPCAEKPAFLVSQVYRGE